jgi:creatinine amidohydrolase
VNRFFKLVTSLALSFSALSIHAQQLSPQWEYLTAEDFVKALETSQHVCLLPFGILEKHGPSGPLGTDLINVRAATLEAVQHEYAIVFPEYYFGQIAEARSQPGTMAYRGDLQLALLQATVDEMGRNGCRKIVIVNGHGGNNALLNYFFQIQLDSPHDYVVYVSQQGPGGAPAPAAAPSRPGVDGHAGEGEISGIMANAPAAAHPERAREESGADQHRLQLPPGLTTAMFWYASFPNHYQGDAAGATAARGEAMRHVRAEGIADAIKFVKADTVSPALQAEFFKKSALPTATPQ